MDHMTFLYRILVQHFDRFSQQKKDVMSHIPSKYAKEMSVKSKVVSGYYKPTRLQQSYFFIGPPWNPPEERE